VGKALLSGFVARAVLEGGVGKALSPGFFEFFSPGLKQNLASAPYKGVLEALI
jgi:hypothetical protein